MPTLSIFALNLEYLEAEFYSVATYGATLVQLGVITSADESGPTTGGNMVKGFAGSPQAYLATALRVSEIDHVKYLRATLGSAAVKKPAINLAALGYGYSSVASFLELSRQFEDVGVSAYLGAAPLISSSTYLAAAGAILATEAQHSGAIRMSCIINGVNSPAVDSLDIPPTSNAVFDVDKNALSIPRTFSQVLNIVYHGGPLVRRVLPQWHEWLYCQPILTNRLGVEISGASLNTSQAALNSKRCPAGLSWRPRARQRYS